MKQFSEIAKGKTESQNLKLYLCFLDFQFYHFLISNNFKSYETPDENPMETPVESILQV